jgi:hypothetical protein
MKIAILGTDAAGHVKPMAEGLHRMLRRISVDSTIFYDGLDQLSRLPAPLRSYLRENGPELTNVARRLVKYLAVDMPATWRFIRRLQGYDAVVIVATVPRAFFRSLFHDQTLRALLPNTPIVLYDVFYLPTRGPWGAWLKEGRPESGIPVGGNWGLERYDWYLCASVVSETPLPSGPQPYSLIGLDLDDGTLYPEAKEEFVALLDFEHPPDMRERAVQIQACEATATHYLVLNGHYSIERIRKIYRRTSVFFLSMRESFGLPICELQACGGYIFTPYANWCPSHWIKPRLFEEGPGELPSNFIIYDNDVERLSSELRRIKASYDPRAVVASFQKFHPHYFRGNEAELSDFVQKLRNRTIHSLSHQEYSHIQGPGSFPGLDPSEPHAHWA